MDNDFVLKVEGISKTFPGVIALDGVDFDLYKGEVHAILGENGAGKSTLIKILSGVYSKDRGEIYFEGKQVKYLNPNEARLLGISVVYQDFPHCPKLDVGQNIFLGREPIKWGMFINWKKLYNDCEKYLKVMNIGLNPYSIVKSLGVADQQAIEIIRALSFKCKILILDEPTSSLSDREIRTLFKNIEYLKDIGTATIFITHKIDEVKMIADRVTVLRDGKKIGTVLKEQININDLIRMMVGREITKQYPKKINVPLKAKPILVVSNLTRKNVLKDVSFSLRKGEILGISGLMGSGRTELARCIFGADKIDSGTIIVDNHKKTLNSPRAALNVGIGLLPEDRRYQGLVLVRSVQENITYPIIDKMDYFGIIKWHLLINKASEYVKKLGIKIVSLQQKVIFLSGGNQQKVVLSKWLAANCKIIILDEPTMGIDIGAKAEIYRLLIDLIRQGVGIILVSSDLQEIVGMSHRAIIMHRGMVAGELSGDEINSENICMLSMGEGESQNEFYK